MPFVVCLILKFGYSRLISYIAFSWWTGLWFIPVAPIPSVAECIYIYIYILCLSIMPSFTSGKSWGTMLSFHAIEYHQNLLSEMQHVNIFPLPVDCNVSLPFQCFDQNDESRTLFRKVFFVFWKKHNQE